MIKSVQTENTMELAEKSKISTILRELMRECDDISEAELTRQVGLPQATINRLLSGATVDPRANTLRPIAHFFNVTIGQLLGDEPITGRVPGSYNPTEYARLSVPILAWENVQDWAQKKHELTPNNHQAWITIETTNIDQHAFALPSLSAMEPRFQAGSILIIDPARPYRDGSYVVVSIKNETVLRKIVMDGSQVYLDVINRTIPAVALDSSCCIHGVLVESRLSF